MRKFLAALAVLAPSLAFAQGLAAPNSPRIQTFEASSGNVANATATATLAPGTGTDGQLVYLCGFTVTSAGATAASVVLVTVTGLNGGPQTYVYPVVAGATLANSILNIGKTSCVQASNSGVSVVVTLPALGAGNTNASVNAWGYRY